MKLNPSRNHRNSYTSHSGSSTSHFKLSREKRKKGTGKNAFVDLLKQDVDDTYMSAGADSFAHAREYYNTTGRAARNNIPGAKTIYEDLKPRFIKTYDDETTNEGSNPVEPISPAIPVSTAGK